jgi:hypothetical protein
VLVAKKNSTKKSPAKSAQKEEVKQEPKEMWDYFALDTKYKKL